MSRRRSGLQPTHIAGAAAFLALAGGGVWYFTRTKTETLAGTPFAAEDFKTQFNGMRGNTYVVKGTIDRSLSYGKDGARLFSLKMNGVPLPVLVPPTITENIQIGQEYQMSVLVERDTVLRVQNLRKS